jgi:hypothetical protein
MTTRARTVSTQTLHRETNGARKPVETALPEGSRKSPLPQLDVRGITSASAESDTVATSLRSIGDRGIKIACRCWLDRQPYDESLHQRYRAARAKPKVQRRCLRNMTAP